MMDLPGEMRIAANFFSMATSQLAGAATITCFGDEPLTVFGDMRPLILGYSCSINPKHSSQMQLFHSPLRLPLKIALAIV